MTTKLTIRRLPDDFEVVAGFYGQDDRLVVKLEVADLKQLVDDHEALLKAAVDFRKSVDGEGGCAFADFARSRLDMAIEQAQREGVEEK